MVKVRVILPPAPISDADGTYVAVSVVASGVKVPVPPVHVALVADPPIMPFSATSAEEEHTAII